MADRKRAGLIAFWDEFEVRFNEIKLGLSFVGNIKDGHVSFLSPSLALLFLRGNRNLVGAYKPKT